MPVKGINELGLEFQIKAFSYWKALDDAEIFSAIPGGSRRVDTRAVPEYIGSTGCPDVRIRIRKRCLIGHRICEWIEVSTLVFSAKDWPCGIEYFALIHGLVTGARDAGNLISYVEEAGKICKIGVCPALGSRRHCCRAYPALRLLVIFPGKEEERFIPTVVNLGYPNRSADSTGIPAGVGDSGSP